MVNTSKSVVTCSEKAKQEIAKALIGYKNESGLDAYIALFVAQRGCSGMAYEMEFVCKPHAKDYVLDDCRLCVRADSIFWLLNTHIDHEDTDLGSSFKFSNPKNKKSCHCGEAFYA